MAPTQSLSRPSDKPSVTAKSILALPNEILDLIAQQVFLKPETEIHLSDAINLAKSCRRFAAVVRRPLLRARPYIVHFAAFWGDINLLRVLLDMGADPNATLPPDVSRAPSGTRYHVNVYFMPFSHITGTFRPYHSLRYGTPDSPHRSLYQSLFGQRNRTFHKYPLEFALQGNHANCIAELARRGAKIDIRYACPPGGNCSFPSGVEPWEWRHCSPLAVGKNGEARLYKTYSDWTALHYTLCQRKQAAFFALVKHGATAISVGEAASESTSNSNSTTRNNFVLHHAVVWGASPSIVSGLLEMPQLRATVNEPSAAGYTPLWAAVCFRKQEAWSVTDLLLRNGADANDQTLAGPGYTPLFHACLHLKAFDFVSLLAHGADPNAVWIPDDDDDGASSSSSSSTAAAANHIKFMRERYEGPSKPPGPAVGECLRPIDARIIVRRVQSMTQRGGPSEEHHCGRVTDANNAWFVRQLLDAGATLETTTGPIVKKNGLVSYAQDSVLLAAAHHRMAILEAMVGHPSFAGYVSRHGGGSRVAETVFQTLRDSPWTDGDEHVDCSYCRGYCERYRNDGRIRMSMSPLDRHVELVKLWLSRGGYLET